MRWQGILEALPIDPAELRVANFAEKQSPSDAPDSHIPSLTADIEAPSPLLVTLFIGRVLSSGVLAELRRCLHSRRSGGLYLGDVCGTAQVRVSSSGSTHLGVGYSSVSTMAGVLCSSLYINRHHA